MPAVSPSLIVNEIIEAIQQSGGVASREFDSAIIVHERQILASCVTRQSLVTRI